jgi:hypothetical protein
MIPVDYELHREYQYERLREAATHRRLAQAIATPRRQASRHLRAPTARPLRMWISTLLGLVPRRFGQAS